MSKLATLTLAFFITIVLTADGIAGCCDSCTSCPSCDTCCCLNIKRAEVDKHCWNIECKDICIPKVVFPWQKFCNKPCGNRGAWVKTVKVLKKHSYTCAECQYQWTPKKICRGEACTGGCASCAQVDTPATDGQIASNGESSPLEATSSLGNLLRMASQPSRLFQSQGE